MTTLPEESIRRPAGSLYEDDFYTWLTTTAERLRHGGLDRADLDLVAEELEDMGRSERHAVASHLAILLQHLLKWQHQPDARSASWSGSIRNARHAIARRLRDSPSLRRFLEDMLADEYPVARLNAADEMGLPADSLPAVCPYTIAQALDDSFWPEP